jgi:ribA/ribD-fused uncharacterized protein
MTDMQKAAQRLLEALDTTPLLKAGDGMLQERIEELRSALEQQEQEPVASDLTTMPGQADAHLRALLRYTENFYATAIAHGMRAGPTANAIAHVERAGKALHQIVHAQAKMLRPGEPEQEPVRPDILEKLSYHLLERDDMTLDDCLTYLQTSGWHKVRGRTERQMVLQITHLLASVPALEQPEQADWTHLKRYGYAPGNYMSRCCRCGESVSGLDKRAVTCKPCAEARHAFEQAAALEQPQQKPIDMVLHCPNCGLQHIDAPEFNSERHDPYPAFGCDPALSWTNPPHRSHLCHGCGHIWRPADVPTNGVVATKTKGKADSITALEQQDQEPVARDDLREDHREPNDSIDSLRGLDTHDRVRFYEHDFYVLSNFSAFTLHWREQRFDTSEAAYHYEKFPHAQCIQEAIRCAPSAHEAFKLAERNKAERRPDWDEVKVQIMLDILRAKVSQHEYVRRKLLETGDRELVEDSWRDDFWGWGPNRDGHNMLGKLWMEVRAELRATTASRQDAAVPWLA